LGGGKMKYGTPIRLVFLTKRKKISDCTCNFRREISDKVMFSRGRMPYVPQERIILMEVLN